MGEFTSNAATTTDISSSVPEFIVAAKALDNGNDGVTYHYFSEAQRNFGYYFEIPEIKSAADALATWTTGRGIEVSDPEMKAQLDHVTGLGNDTFQEILWNHEVTKLIVGDSFLEIVWLDKKKTKIANLIPISPERVRVKIEKNRIQGYDVWNGSKWKPLVKENVIHSMNKRVGDQIHGTSQIDACLRVINARFEALETMRILELRSRALGIAYYKTDNTGKISYANSQIEKAVKKGQMLGLPEDTVEIKDFPQRDPNDRLPIVQYYENFFYQVFEVPRSIATSDGTSEVGGKMGHVIFEPIYTKEQIDLEGDFRQQAGIIFKLNRPPSLGGLVHETEQKNTSQTSIQPNDVEATLTRE